MLELQKCRSCSAGIYWLLQSKREFDPRVGKVVSREVLGAKPNPIDAAPNKNGTLIIDRNGGRHYRFATGSEIEVARNSGRNLYISHFETCPNAKQHRNQRVMEAK